MFECRIWYLLLKRHKGKRKTWKQIYKWTDRHKTYTSGFMATLRRKCISLFREYPNFLPTKTKRIKRVKTYEDIIFTVRFCKSNLLIFRFNWQRQKKNQKNQMCLMTPKTKCYPQGRDRLWLKLASSPQVKGLLWEIVISCSPRQLLFVKYCIFRYLSYIVSQMYSFWCYFGLAVKMHPANEILLIISHWEYDCIAEGLRKVKLSWSRSTCPAYNEM